MSKKLYLQPRQIETQRNADRTAWEAWLTGERGEYQHPAET